MSYKHGMSGTKFYKAWHNMKSRCGNPNFAHYADYGGRGISVCARWMDFVNFKKDMFSTYAENLQIDRFDNNLGYSPENCRWVTRSENCRNQRHQKNNISGTKGVCWNKVCKKWMVRINNGGKQIHLGLFSDKSEAIAARKAAEIKYGYKNS